jgi:hypothetical protein
MGNDHLIKFHLTFSVDQKFLIVLAFDQINFWRLIKIFNNKIFIFYHLTEFFETFQLIEILKLLKMTLIKVSIN